VRSKFDRSTQTWIAFVRPIRVGSRVRLIVVLVTCACASPRPAEAPQKSRVALSGPATVAVPPPVDVHEDRPYDLAADRARLEEQAKEELGSSVRALIVQESFVLVAAPGWDARALAASQQLTTSAINAYFNHRFAKRPAKAVAVYLFPNAAPYQAFCKAHMGGACLSKYGSYHPDRRWIVMNAGLGLGTLTHELIHPIVETDFPSAPIWINEGIASLFEAPVITGPGEITGTKNWRLPRLMTSLTTVRFESLFGMDDATFRDASEDLHYAQARYMCQWLDEKGWLFPFYQRWRDSTDDPTGEKSFEAVTEMTPAKAHNAWLVWLRTL
jgi:hypothetical protein